nr:unnamed protein product [Callosobruchus chinensis]
MKVPSVQKGISSS